MAKKNIKNTATSTTIGDVVIRINQKLHGIEVQGDNITTQQGARLKNLGYYFSKRKGLYYTDFNADVYQMTIDYFESYAKSKAKNNGAEPKTLAQAAPINMAEAFPGTKVKSTKKSRPAKKAEPKKAEPKKAEVNDLDYLFGFEDEEPKSTETEEQVVMEAVKAEPKPKKENKSKAKKAEPSPAPAKAESKEPVETDDLKLWKAQVLMAVEKILDDSILALAKGEAA